MCTKSEYSRYFRTGVENPSEEWHFSGISYALPPQALTGNPWGTFENNVEEGAQLDFTSQCWRVSSTDILQHCLSSITQEELSCLSLQPGTKPGVVKHNCCSALRIPQTSAIPATLWMLSVPLSPWAVHPALHWLWAATQTRQEISLCSYAHLLQFQLTVISERWSNLNTQGLR